MDAVAGRVDEVLGDAVGRGAEGPELAGGLEASAARVDAAACEAGLCWRCELVVDGCGGSDGADGREAE